MTKTFRTLLLWFLLMTVIFLAWHFAQIQRKEDITPFSDFLTRVDAGEVRSVRIDMRGQGPAAIFRVRLNDGRQLRADGFYSDSVLEALRAAEVPFWTHADETPAWANLLVSWAPFLLLIGFWVFFMQKFKSGGGSAGHGAHGRGRAPRSREPARLARWSVRDRGGDALRAGRTGQG